MDPRAIFPRLWTARVQRDAGVPKDSRPSGPGWPSITTGPDPVVLEQRHADKGRCKHGEPAPRHAIPNRAHESRARDRARFRRRPVPERANRTLASADADPHGNRDLWPDGPLPGQELRGPPARLATLLPLQRRHGARSRASPTPIPHAVAGSVLRVRDAARLPAGARQLGAHARRDAIRARRAQGRKGHGAENGALRRSRRHAGAVLRAVVVRRVSRQRQVLVDGPAPAIRGLVHSGR